MKTSNIKPIQEEQLSLDDSMQVSTSLNGSFSSVYSKKRSSMYRSQIYQKYLKKDFDFTQDEDLQMIFEIIQKQNHLKTTQDMMILQNAFKNIKLFQELADQIPQKQLFNLFKELLHYEYQSRQVVFKQGEIGKEFYIILKGAVYIIGNEDKKHQNNETITFLNDDDKKQQQCEDKNSKEQIEEEKNSALPQTNVPIIRKKQSTFHQYRKSDQGQTLSDIQQSITFSRQNTIQTKGLQFLSNMSCTTSYSFLNDLGDDEEYIKQAYPDLDILAKLEAGSSFGEVALKDSVPRTATVICSGETHFITLKRDVFKKFLEQYYSVVQSQNISFVKKISLFQNWTDQMVNQMFYFLEKQTFRMNQPIYKEGSQPLGIYLIKQGEIKRSYSFSFKIKLYQEMLLKSTGQHDKLKGIRHFLRQSETPKNSVFQAPVSHIAEEQMFGHEDIVNQQPRKYTAICSSSSCTLFFLNKERFIQFSKRRNTFENAIEESAIKSEWHQKIISKLESFSKNQHEFYEMKEQKQKKTINEKLSSNNQLQSKAQVNRINPTQKGLNRSMPSMHKSITQQSFSQINSDLTPQNMILASSIVGIPEFQDEYDDFRKLDSNNCDSQLRISQNLCQYQNTNYSGKQKTEPQKIINTDQNLSIKKTNQNVFHQLVAYPPLNYENFRVLNQQSKRKSNPSLEVNMNIQQSNNLKQKVQSKKMQTETSNNSQLCLSPLFQKYQMAQTINSSFQKIEDQSQTNYSHKRFLSQNNDTQHKFVEIKQYEKNTRNTIRRQSIRKDKVVQEIMESIRFPRRMHQSCHCPQDNSIGNSQYEHTVQQKLDLDNQLIPVCSNQLLISKRGDSQKTTNQSKASPQFQSPQIKELQDQKRILSTLKLPRVYKNTFNFKEIFNQNSSENLKSSNQPQLFFNENIVSLQKEDELKDNIKQQQTDNNTSTLNKYNSIIETLNQMKINIQNKQTKNKNQNEQKEKQGQVIQQSKNLNIKRQSLNCSPIQTIQKQPYKIQNFSMYQLDKFCHKTQFSYQPNTQIKSNQIVSIDT